MTAGTMTRSDEWQGVTDADVPLIGWSIIPDHPLWAYLADEDASRPATPTEMEALEAAAHAEYEAFLAVPVSPKPHPPMCACNRKDAAPEPEPAAVTVVDQPAAQDDPGPIHCDCQDDAPEQPDEDPAPVLNPIAEMAAETHGLGPLDAAKEAAAVRFAEAHDAEDKRTATTQLAAVGDDTEVSPAITEDHEGAENT